MDEKKRRNDYKEKVGHIDHDHERVNECKGYKTINEIGNFEKKSEAQMEKENSGEGGEKERNTLEIMRERAK